MIIKYWDKLKNALFNKVIIRKKGVFISLVCLVLFLIGYKLLPNAYSTIGSSIKYYVIIDSVLCLLIGVKFRLSEKWERYFAFGMLMIAPAINFFCLETVISNDIFSMQLLVAVLNYIIYLSVYLVIYFITNRIRVSVILADVLLCFTALMNSFVDEFRGNSVRASDLFAIKTAANVAGGYSFVFTEVRSKVLLICIAVLLIAFHIDYKELGLKKKIQQRILIAVICIGLCNTVFSKSYIETKGLKPYIWEMKASAKDHGSMLDFSMSLSYLKVEKPDGYSKKTAQKIESDNAEIYEKTTNHLNNMGQKNPDIIVVMNESLSDLERFDTLKLNGECLPKFNAMKEDVVRGNVSVPVWGARTANTEFEFLTGFSNAFLPPEVIAFQNYVKEGTYNIGKHLKEQGYYSIFMHPFLKDGWNRSNVYPAFGFDEALYLEDYTHTDVIRNTVSDSANYKEVIERYEKAKESQENVFIFNVTMQNHGGYTSNQIEKNIKILEPEGNYPKAEEYLNLIKASDDAFQELVQYFSEKEEPVVICMFGDHLPVIEEELTETMLQQMDGNEAEKLARKYQTPFLIYANYDIEEKEYENISVNFLQTVLLETAEIPLNTYQKYLGSLCEIYPVINEFGVKDENGNWYTWEEAEQFKEIKEYSLVQYKNMFSH